MSTRRERHTSAIRTNARACFELWNIEPDQDFHTLSTEQVDNVLDEADRRRYQKPKYATGSRARYFYQRLQREVKKGRKS